tara:strand:- start:22 stop:1623 length:1602 start_codon:yes stop_codon:yes gene_type:complete
MNIPPIHILHSIPYSLIFFLSFSSSFATSKALYNIATREVITPDSVNSSQTEWSLLDAQNANFSSYSHPAYYSSVVHQVVDSSTGSKVGNWILVPVPKALYNSETKEFVTPQQIQSGGTDWLIVDPNPSYTSGYSHPAYYSKSALKVLDSSQDSQVGQWILAEHTFPLQTVDDGNSSGNSQEGNSSSVNKVLYNIETKQVITPEQVASGSTDWLLLSPAKYPDKYKHPAFYNLNFHRVVEDLESDVENGWTLKDPGSVDQNATNPDLAKVLYNTSTQEMLNRTQIEAGGTEWMILPPGFEGNDGSTYSYPAYYNQTTKGILDNSPGDAEGNWVLSSLTVTITATVAEGGTVTGDGSYDLKSTVLLAASPSSGYLFSSWSGGVESSLNPVSLVAGSDLQVTANFSKDDKDDDGDGLTNYEELVLHASSPSLVDTDGDGLSDKEEVLAGMDAKTSDKALIDQISAAIGSRGATETPYTDGWFYLPDRGWLFTNIGSYPYFYESNASNWLYFQSGGEKPRFYNYGSKSWITIESTE